MPTAQIIFTIALSVVSIVIFAFAAYVLSTTARNSKGPESYVPSSSDSGSGKIHGKLVEDN